jgi:hypothetical protein
MELSAQVRPARPGAFDQGTGAVNFDNPTAFDAPDQPELREPRSSRGAG